ncbi:exported hypothetical protein [Frankia canadensis]|uniref:Uncharacterized protein n=1 Tax=Frankia canadensis TaxID=1836972 RepID=A0A2I2KTI9_9ACTN|nr:hypothetical protein [Frankia canadensis]SNQ48972.1 exported hypothetical protein [Frankia canadensis]SOU56262.1 exported hypothetical protein [Frankia canadensis]
MVSPTPDRAAPVLVVVVVLAPHGDSTQAGAPKTAPEPLKPDPSSSGDAPSPARTRNRWRVAVGLTTAALLAATGLVNVAGLATEVWGGAFFLVIDGVLRGQGTR